MTEQQGARSEGTALQRLGVGELTMSGGQKLTFRMALGYHRGASPNLKYSSCSLADSCVTLDGRLAKST